MAAYIKAIVTFIDILGFKEIVETRTPDEIKRIIGFLIQVCDEATIPDEPPKVFEMRYINFSDSIVRTSRISDEDDRYEVNLKVILELNAIMHIQRSLIQEGVIVRGGITVGEIFVEDKMIFGPALNRAYHLESKVAVYPRVLIDGAVHQRLHDNVVLGDMKYIWRDDDGQFFVDYLVGNIGQLWEFGMDPDLVRESLVVHRELIMRNRKKHKEDSRNLAKYNWLATYHNQVLARFEEAGGELLCRWCGASREELRVDLSDIGPKSE